MKFFTIFATAVSSLATLVSAPTIHESEATIYLPSGSGACFDLGYKATINVFGEMETCAAATTTRIASVSVFPGLVSTTTAATAAVPARTATATAPSPTPSKTVGFCTTENKTERDIQKVVWAAVSAIISPLWDFFDLFGLRDVFVEAKAVALLLAVLSWMASIYFGGANLQCSSSRKQFFIDLANFLVVLLLVMWAWLPKAAKLREAMEKKKKAKKQTEDGARLAEDDWERMISL